MKNRLETNNLIVSDVIKSRCHIKSTSLYYNEYDNMLPQELKLSNIIYCDIRNISESSVAGDTKITVFIDFDLLMIYESATIDNVREYHFHTERISRSINIDTSLYSVQFTSGNTKNSRLRNLIGDIRCFADIDINSKKIIVSITTSIDSLLLSEGIVELPNSPVQQNNELKPGGNEFVAVDKQPLTEGEESLDQYIYQLSTLLEKASRMQDDNKRISNECEAKDNRLSFLEYKNKQFEQECNNLRQEVKQKQAIIQGLKYSLDNDERRISELLSANLASCDEIKFIKKENADLKAYIAEEENKKKNGFNYKIKSVINKLII